MNAEQTIEVINAAALQEKARSLREKNFRLVQISATRLPDSVELTYSFDLDFRLVNLRVSISGTDAHVPSISSIYGCAVLYENEIHDLFNVTVDGLALDFKGNFYKTAVKFPFGSTKAPVAKPDAPVPAKVSPAPQ